MQPLLKIVNGSMRNFSRLR